MTVKAETDALPCWKDHLRPFVEAVVCCQSRCRSNRWGSPQVCSVACVWKHVLHTLTLSAFGLQHQHISKNMADMYPNSTWAFGGGCDGDWLHSINIYSQYFQDLLPSAAHLPLTAWWSSKRRTVLVFDIQINGTGQDWTALRGRWVMGEYQK